MGRKGQSVRVFSQKLGVEMLWLVSRQVLVTVWWWESIRLFPRGGRDQLPAGGYGTDTEDSLPEEPDAIRSGNVLSGAGRGDLQRLVTVWQLMSFFFFKLYFTEEPSERQGPAEHAAVQHADAAKECQAEGEVRPWR